VNNGEIMHECRLEQGKCGKMKNAWVKINQTDDKNRKKCNSVIVMLFAS